MQHMLRLDGLVMACLAVLSAVAGLANTMHYPCRTRVGDKKATPPVVSTLHPFVSVPWWERKEGVKVGKGRKGEGRLAGRYARWKKKITTPHFFIDTATGSLYKSAICCIWVTLECSKYNAAQVGKGRPVQLRGGLDIDIGVTRSGRTGETHYRILRR